MRKRYKWSRRGFVVAGAMTLGAMAAGCGRAPGQPERAGAGEPPKGRVPEAKDIPKFVAPLLVPSAMPSAGTVKGADGRDVDYYEISVRQFEQPMLPEGMPKTTVWGYGAVGKPDTYNAPSLTIEATHGTPVRVKWVNDLVDEQGNALPHLLPVDQTLHWANPAGGEKSRDMRGTDPKPYLGPVPMVTHVHGAHTHDDSDGYPQAWYLPDAADVPTGYAKTGSWYEEFSAKAKGRFGAEWGPGFSVFQYPNDQRATTLWYHDHTLGMTRLNVYAGPAGFYLVRGGPDDVVEDTVSSRMGAGVLPGGEGDDPRFEIPLAIQDRSFAEDGSLSYPDGRAFFEELEPEQLKIPFIPARACEGPSDVSPIWNPEFFGETIIVNGKTWPFHEVEPRRYRLRFLNGCQSRFLILRFDGGLPLHQIGAEGGFLLQPVKLDQLLMGPAERADVIVDFTDVKPGTRVRLLNIGPDEPYNGKPGFEPADRESTGQVMEFRVVASTAGDPSTPVDRLQLPKRTPLGAATVTRQVALVEEDSATVRVVKEADGSLVLACDDKEAEAFGPTAALCGVVEEGEGKGLMWMDPITENPAPGSTEVWEIHNFTMDAHPIHIHQVMFEVLDRTPMPKPMGSGGKRRGCEPGETGPKDTVIAYPGEVTRVKARFDLAGVYVWHCHIVEHEDNEMMRPYVVGPVPKELMG